MVLSVPGEVLCSRKVLVLLVTFDLWLSLVCFLCLFLDLVVVLLLLACWTWAGLGSQAAPALLENGGLPASPGSLHLPCSSATWSQ